MTIIVASLIAVIAAIYYLWGPVADRTEDPDMEDES